MVYRKSLHEHVVHLYGVFDVHKREQLYSNIEICSFCVDEVVLLGFVISSSGIEADESKIEALRIFSL